ncbi:MAG: hypothetical protein AB1597_02795 [Chloroflexota bacterium]
MGAIKDVPQMPYSHIITEFHVDPDWAYSRLRCVEDRDKAKKIRRYRIFDMDVISANKGFKVKDYASFDAHPEMVMFEGFVTDDGQVSLTRNDASKPA